MIFLDTNVVSEVMRLKPNWPVVEWLARHEAELALSTVVIGEIAAGIERIRLAERSPRLSAHLNALRRRYEGRIHVFDEESAMIYGAIMGKAARSGRPTAAADGMIAAIALRHSAMLATRNTADFGAFALKVISPWD